MDFFLIIFYLFALTTSSCAQNLYTLDSVNLSSKVSCTIIYKWMNDQYTTNAKAHKKNRKYLFPEEFIFPVQVVDYYYPPTGIDIRPRFNDNTKALSDYLKTQPEALHDSIIYAHLKQEMAPNHFSSYFCLSHKISPLKKWQGKYHYVDTEEVYVNWEEGDEKLYYTYSYRLLWVDSCQYEFSVVTYSEKKRELKCARRCVEYNFQELVNSVYVREEDELVELKKEE
jgi:hypothetical protein